MLGWSVGLGMIEIVEIVIIEIVLVFLVFLRGHAAICGHRAGSPSPLALTELLSFTDTPHKVPSSPHKVHRYITIQGSFFPASE